MNDASRNPTVVREILKRELSNIAPETDLDALESSADLRQELDLDSFDFVRYITAVCAALDMDVPEQDYIQFSTLAQAEQYLIGRA